MNVYLYEGKDREDMGDNLEKYDGTMKVDKLYTVDPRDGMVLIAYPNKNKVTEFEFEYYLVADDFISSSINEIEQVLIDLSP